MGRPGYVQFATTPHARAAIGLTDEGIVQVLAPAETRGDWKVLREWPTSAYGQSDLLVRLGTVEEPDTAESLVASLPPETLG